MEKELSEWIGQIKVCKNKEELKSCIENLNLSELIKNQEDGNKMLNIMCEKIKEVPLEMVPEVLDVLYTTSNVDKFYLFCALLETVYNSLPHITHLENYPINKGKFNLMLPSIMRVLGKYPGNYLNNCMWMILLEVLSDKDLFKELFDDRSINIFQKIIENETNIIVDWLKKENNYETLSNGNLLSLEILMDVAGYFMTDQTVKNMVEILKVKDVNVKLYTIISLLKNNQEIADDILQSIGSNAVVASRFLDQLERIGKAEKYPKAFAQQEFIAMSNMINWLAHPSELGRIPNKVEFLGTVARNGNDFYIYQFLTDVENLKNRGWMLGISGGYPQGRFTANNPATFSKLETCQEDYKKQAVELIDFIENYWKERAKQIKA